MCPADPYTKHLNVRAQSYKGGHARIDQNVSFLCLCKSALDKYIILPAFILMTLEIIILIFIFLSNSLWGDNKYIKMNN